MRKIVYPSRYPLEHELLCEFSRKKENLSPERYSAPLFILPILHCVQHADIPLSREASRLNDLLFEVVAVATPHVAYAFVTKRLSALHTYNRAGRYAGTRRATKSQASRCSYLGEKPSI
jgi:hypothetical protein